VTTWTFIRFLHLVGVVFFVGGQLVLLVAVTPVLRASSANDATMRAIARRFGIGSVVAPALVIATGVAMATHLSLWGRSVLQVKLGVLVLVGVLTALHIVSAKTRALSVALVVGSLLIVWLGVRLTYG
jgi:uncharacterized membrane protein